MSLKRLRMLKKIYYDYLPDNYVPSTQMQADTFYRYHPKFGDSDSLKGCRKIKADLIEAGVLGRLGTVNYSTNTGNLGLTGYSYVQESEIRDILDKLNEKLKEALRVERVKWYTDLLGFYALFSSVALGGMIYNSFGELAGGLAGLGMIGIIHVAIKLSQLVR